MGQFYRAVLYRNQITAVALGFVLLVLCLAGLPVSAQSGCTGDPCLFYTPTGTSTSTPYPTPGTGTPTRVAMPNPSPFPRPNYGVPTSIPNASFPAVPSPIAVTLPVPSTPNNLTPTPWAIASPLAAPTLLAAPAAISLSHITLSDTTAISLTEINTDLEITHSTLLTLNGAGSVTNTAGAGLAGELDSGGRGIISDVNTYNTYLTNQIISVQYTDTITMYTAPDWYAPYLPREMANVGWTFEQIDDNSTARYSLNTWSYLFGAMIAMPIRLVRGIFDLFRFMGPFGLFLLWLLVIMLPAVLGFKILLFIKNTIVRLINFALSVIDWILKLWNSIPWYFGGPG